uniref:Multicopper oxidase n=1 Tax=Mucochytrium quahogii TaxID=96639 RepID=A0A7S2SET7_9STRA|mmetsp:Transcript_8580/g.13917  ORF Transcript_8580/g.13917 Transcript_8580/m.13917 type:complete len:577 (-) Transcript_8580:28-1758(-)
MYGSVPTVDDPGIDVAVPAVQRKPSNCFSTALGLLAGALFVVLAILAGWQVIRQGRVVVDKVAVERFEQPRLLVSEKGMLNVTLDVVVGQVHFSALTFNMRSFNGTYPPPTLVLERGDILRVLVRNRLGAENASAGNTWNGFRYPNTTVIHTHGFHVSPVTADNIYRKIGPNHSALFEYKIPRNHNTGTFYLHPHFHGSSALQVAYGMAMAIVIKDLPSKKRLFVEDNVMLVNWIDVGSGKRTDVVEDSRISGSTLDLDLHPSSSKDGFLVVNGKRNPRLDIKAGEMYRWRVINSIIDGTMRLVFSSSCSVAEIAADGVSYETARVRTQTQGIIIPPGSRRDLAVECISRQTGDIVQVRSELVLGKSYANLTRAYLGDGTKISTGDFVHIAFVNTTLPLGTSTASLDVSQRYSIKREEAGYTPEPLRDLRDEKPASTHVIEYTQAGPNTPKVIRDGTPYSFLGINGQAYSTKTILKVKRDQVTEWVIQNEWCMDGTPATESHPFHLHTNHFQVVHITGSLSPDYKVGDWRDTITVPAPGNVTIRWVPRDFIGKTVMHCHTLGHEDTGMMANFEITD